MSSRPQNKNLIPLTERSPEEAYAIRSKGQKAQTAKRKMRTEQAYLIGKYAGTPILDKRTIAKFERMGFEDEELSKALEITHAIMQGARAGDPRMIDIYLRLTGEDQNVLKPRPNNLLDALVGSTKEDMDTDDLPEVREAAKPDDDMVEPTEL